MRTPPVFWASVTLAFFAGPSIAGDHPYDARGVYYHTFSGSFSGSEWFQCFQLDAPGSVHMGDVQAAGAWGGAVDAQGQILLGDGVATGSFSSPDDFTLHLTVSGFVFDSVMNRVPGTDHDFPVRLERVLPSNSKLAGAWSGPRRRVDPRTGQTQLTEESRVSVSTDLLSISLEVPDLGVFAGVFNTHEQAGFRVVAPRPSDARYRSFPGSSISISRNMLGELIVEDINTLRWTLLLQTRQPVGAQSQTLWHFSLTRDEPVEIGDVNADGLLDAQDRGIIAGLAGSSVIDPGFDLFADLNRDDVIDVEDIAAWDRVNAGCPVRSADLDQNGRLNFFDVSLFLDAFLAQNPDADFTGDGGFSFFDVSVFLDALSMGCV